MTFVRGKSLLKALEKYNVMNCDTSSHNHYINYELLETFLIPSLLTTKLNSDFSSGIDKAI